VRFPCGVHKHRLFFRDRFWYAVIMLLDLVLTAEVFEAVMLVCFGVSWPVSIVKTLRVRRVEGKSQVFLILVLLGYVTGVIAKLLYAAAHEEAIPRVTWLYVLNGAMVFIDLMLYRTFRAKGSPATGSS